MTELTGSAFASFYEQLWASDDESPPRRAYLWQRRAAAELAQGTLWPALAAPTAAGKTSLLEIYLFALACRATHDEHDLPRRLFWIVDRRSVVDQVHAHAQEVRSRLAARRPMLDAVRRALADLGAHESDGEVVQLRRWRGGLGGEASVDRAPLNPAMPAIVCSTVDQVGSRMLFRGYGVGPRSRAIDAALTATDCVVVLDEAHLSGPYLQTAAAVARRQAGSGGLVPAARILPVSATLDDRERAFVLTDKERADPRLVQRLRSRKLARLASRGGEAESRAVGEARRLAGDGPSVVGVVMNTVREARAVHRRLAHQDDALLVIGPCRPIDREAVLSEIPGRDARADRTRPLFVVATQTIEVGLDLDFDALVTACAPLPALVQRLGRLDREGSLGTSQAVVLPPPASCPIYGAATEATWQWLVATGARDGIDLGSEGLAQLTPPGDLAPEPARAPLLGPWHVEALAQTSHPPDPDPDVGVFLHGERALDGADVQVCWRTDLEPGASDAEWETRVALRPPHAGELVSLSVSSVRRWLADQEDADAISDIESLDAPATQFRSRHRFVRVPPRDRDGRLHPRVEERGRQPRAGEVIVVPAGYGGCDRFGWNPTGTKAVADYGNLDPARARVLVRGPESQQLSVALAKALAAVEAEDAPDAETYLRLREPTREWLESGGSFPDSSAGAARAAAVGASLPEVGRGLVLPGGRDVVLIGSAAGAASARRVSYERHVDNVVAHVERSCRALRLPRPLAATLVDAAYHHDLGKLDPRFQSWLAGGAAHDPAGSLAKSGMVDGRVIERARVAAGWPDGKRHEHISASLVAAGESWPEDVDRDLLVHLVLTHHGDGRPLLAWSPDDAPVEVMTSLRHGEHVSVMSDAVIPWPEHAERFLRLTRRFGPWGLAHLEAVLMLADRAASAEESGG